MQAQVGLLGGLSVGLDGVAVDPSAWRSRPPSQLVTLLAPAPGHRLTTEQTRDAL